MNKVVELLDTRVGFGVLTLGALLIGTRFIRSMRNKARCASIRQRKLAERDELLKRVEEWVAAAEPSSARVAEVTAMPVEELVKAMKNGKFLAVDVLRVFYKCALAAHRRTNCLTEICFDDAIKDAALADAHLRKTGELIGPLHGLPVSIKDNVNVQGYDSTIGLHADAFKPAAADAALVTIIRNAGGIVHVKTNVPQTMLSLECDNPIFGRGLNPYSKDHTCGGSSGGEGALLALNGSALGVGSDIGGSVRIPAVFCGVAGLKPSQFRIPNRGFTSPMTGIEAVASVPGIMGRSARDLEYFFSAIINGKPWEHDGNAMCNPLRGAELVTFGTKKLTIGYYVDDGAVRPTAPCQRAVRETVEALQAAGHTVVEFKVPEVEAVCRLFYSIVGSDGARSVTTYLRGEPPTYVVGSLLKKMNAPGFLKRLLAVLIRQRDPCLAALLLGLQEVSIATLYALTRERSYTRHCFSDKFYESRVDAVIGPGFCIPAPRHDDTAETSFVALSTGIYNLLDSSVCVIPVTRVDKNIDIPVALDGVAFPMINAKAHAMFNAEEMHDLPVGVQVIAPRANEERVLGVAVAIQAALDKKRGKK